MTNDSQLQKYFTNDLVLLYVQKYVIKYIADLVSITLLFPI